VSTYFSDRDGQQQPRTQETIGPQAWAGLFALIRSRIVDGSLGFGFPAQCPDSTAIIGTDERLVWDRAIAEIPRLRPVQAEPWNEYEPPWSPSREQTPPTDAVLDLLELLARNVGLPGRIGHHSYFGHDHLNYDRDEGLSLWIADVNILLARSGLAFEMVPDGTIRRLLSSQLRDLIHATEFATGDADTDQLLSRAGALLTDRKPHAHEDALEKLWDAFERMKTLMPGDKKTSVTALLTATAATNAPIFNTAIGEEFRALTTLGNSLRIRHSETDKEPVSSRREAEYLFQRMFSLLRYVLLQTGRVRLS
jgi:hypothetical protein